MKLNGINSQPWIKNLEDFAKQAELEESYSDVYSKCRVHLYVAKDHLSSTSPLVFKVGQLDSGWEKPSTISCIQISKMLLNENTRSASTYNAMVGFSYSRTTNVISFSGLNYNLISTTHNIVTAKPKLGEN